MRAMIFAAGLGTRLKYLTSDKPKALVELGGKPLLEYAVNYLKNFGVNEVVINIHHFGNQIIDYIRSRGDFGITVKISDERDYLLDTGGGLKKAAPLFSGTEPVILYNVDIFTSLDLSVMLSYHQQQKALVTLAVRKREGSRYLLFDRQNCLSGWKNIKTDEVKISRPDSFNDSEMFAFSGIHVINPEIFNMISEEGKFSVIDLYLRLAKTHPIKAFVDDSETWFDLGTVENIAEAEKIVQHFKNGK